VELDEGHSEGDKIVCALIGEYLACICTGQKTEVQDIGFFCGMTNRFQNIIEQQGFVGDQIFAFRVVC
jgi:hypothetical protein